LWCRRLTDERLVPQTLIKALGRPGDRIQMNVVALGGAVASIWGTITAADPPTASERFGTSIPCVSARVRTESLPERALPAITRGPTGPH
jgi:hypothetical protein